jgi:hypothetical protein
MTTTARNFARLAALPALGHVWHVAGEVIVTAALGFVDTTDADTIEHAPTDPGYSYSPDAHAKPAPTATGGRNGHHGPQHIADLLNR